jgi:hypothetical protein
MPNRNPNNALYPPPSLSLAGTLTTYRCASRSRELTLRSLPGETGIPVTTWPIPIWRDELRELLRAIDSTTRASMTWLEERVVLLRVALPLWMAWGEG